MAVDRKISELGIVTSTLLDDYILLTRLGEPVPTDRNKRITYANYFQQSSVVPTFGGLDLEGDLNLEENKIDMRDGDDFVKSYYRTADDTYNVECGSDSPPSNTIRFSIKRSTGIPTFSALGLANGIILVDTNGTLSAGTVLPTATTCATPSLAAEVVNKDYVDNHSGLTKWTESGGVIFPNTLTNRLGIGVNTTTARGHFHEATDVACGIQLTNALTTSATGKGVILAQLGTPDLFPGYGLLQAENPFVFNIDGNINGFIAGDGRLMWNYDINVADVDKFTCDSSPLSINAVAEELTVGYEHCDYADANSANNSISDATEIKPYSVKIATDFYNAQIDTNKANVFFDGRLAHFGQQIEAADGMRGHIGYSKVFSGVGLYSNMGGFDKFSQWTIDHMDSQGTVGVTCNSGILNVLCNLAYHYDDSSDGAGAYGYETGLGGGLLSAITNMIHTEVESGEEAYGIYTRDGFQYHIVNTLLASGDGSSIGWGAEDDAHSAYVLSNILGGDKCFDWNGGENLLMTNAIINSSATASTIDGSNTNYITANYNESDIVIGAGSTLYAMINRNNATITNNGTLIGMVGNDFYGDKTFHNDIDGVNINISGVLNTDFDFSSTGSEARFTTTRTGASDVVTHELAVPSTGTTFNYYNIGGGISGQIRCASDGMGMGRAGDEFTSKEVFLIDTTNRGIKRYLITRQTVTTGTYNSLDIGIYNCFSFNTVGGNIVWNGVQNGIDRQDNITYMKTHASNSLTVNSQSVSATQQLRPTNGLNPIVYGAANWGRGTCGFHGSHLYVGAAR